jgi:purine-binding chemotaxis protein CheW
VLVEAPIPRVGIPIDMEAATSFLICTLDTQRYAFRLGIVQRVLRAAAVVPLPKAPKGILGMVNISGQITPVLNLRQRFGLPARELDPNDRFIVVRTTRCSLILVMDVVVEVRECDLEKKIPLRHVLPRAKVGAGIECFANGLIVVHTVESLLSAEEEQMLTKALIHASEVR